MKIAELEAHHNAFIESELSIRHLVDIHEFPGVFSACLHSFPHIVPAIKYRKKKAIHPEIPALFSFATICKYAPPLFEHNAIELLSEFVKSTRFLARHEHGYLGLIEAARNREEVARTFWNRLEQHPGIFQRDVHSSIGVSQKDITDIIEVWDVLGIIDRQSKEEDFQLHLKTQLKSELTGLCPNCGVRGKGRKELFFSSVTCQKCGTQGHYHIEYVQRQ